MNIEVACPYCRFSKSVPREAIPTMARKALCPRCGRHFEFAWSDEGARLVTMPWQTPSEDPGGALAFQEPAPGRHPCSWEGGQEFGGWKAWWHTFRPVLFFPSTFFRTLSTRNGLGAPLAFGLLCGGLGGMFTAFWQVLAPWRDVLGIGDLLMAWGSPVTLFFVFFLMIPAMVAVGTLFYSLTLHLLLRCVGAGGQGFEATFRVVCYSQSAQLWSLVPLVGGLIGTLWQVVIQVIGLKAIHETGLLRVVLAFLLPLVLLLLIGLTGLSFLGRH